MIWILTSLYQTLKPEIRKEVILLSEVYEVNMKVGQEIQGLRSLQMSQ